MVCADEANREAILMPIKRVGSSKIAVSPAVNTRAAVIKSQQAEGF